MVPGAVAVVVFIWTFGLIVATGLIPVRAAFAEQQRTIRSMTVIKSVLRRHNGRCGTACSIGDPVIPAFNGNVY
jgi:hypothetical protein